MVRAVRNINAGNIIYRGVAWDRRPDLIAQLSYPPPDQGEPVWATKSAGTISFFYGSAGSPGVFFELKAREGGLIAWSKWQVKEPLCMRNLGYHADALVRLGATPNSAHLTLTQPIPNETPRNRRLRRKVALAFTEDITPGFEYRYKQSVAITEFWCEHHQPLPIEPGGPRTDEIAGVTYPSPQMRGDADNVIFWPKFVHSSLALAQVQYVLVENADYSRLAFSLLTVGIANEFSNDVSIKWLDVLPSENERRCHISFEDGKWVLRGDSI
jgi:hypothetical protein